MKRGRSLYIRVMFQTRARSIPKQILTYSVFAYALYSVPHFCLSIPIYSSVHDIHLRPYSYDGCYIDLETGLDSTEVTGEVLENRVIV
jgi:hypothetical protein